MIRVKHNHCLPGLVAGAALCAVLALTGCQQTPTANTDPSANEASGQPSISANEATSIEEGTNGEEPLLGLSMADGAEALTVSSDTYENLGWTGQMNIKISSATLYENFEAAEKATPGLVAQDNAIKDGPILVCEVGIENAGATSDSGKKDVFSLDFLYLGPERTTPSFAIPESKDISNGKLLDFALTEDKMTPVVIGFSVPESWYTESVALPSQVYYSPGSELGGQDYLAFGGTPREYTVSETDGIVPTTPFFWLTTSIIKSDKA